MKKEFGRRRNFHHLNQTDRDRMEALLTAGHTQKEIAGILKVHPSSISRERRRKRKNGFYEARTAQHKAQIKRCNSKFQGMKIHQHPELEARIISELQHKRSPDEIAGRMKLEGLEPRIGTNTIYKWLYSAYGNRYAQYLCTRRYKKRNNEKKTKREMIPNRVSLTKRPFEGIHAEGDLFVSPTKTGTTRSGAVMGVPSTKLLVGQMIENRKPSTMVEATNSLLLTVSVNDITLDNGVENKNHHQMTVPAYFCDSYSPWQKPFIENSILLIRRWCIPKKTDLRTVSDQDFQEHLHFLNHKYRKSLGYRSAYEVSLERGIIQTIPLLGGIVRKNCNSLENSPFIRYFHNSTL